MHMDLWHYKINCKKVPIKKWAKMNHLALSSNWDFYSFEDKTQSEHLRASVCRPRVISRQPRKLHISKIRSWNQKCSIINMFIKQLYHHQTDNSNNKINSVFFWNPQNTINRRNSNYDTVLNLVIKNSNISITSLPIFLTWYLVK